MIHNFSYDVAVVGAGAAGLAAAKEIAAAGFRTVAIDREELPGGILRQCIHNGFGLEYFNEELTGPEYAGKVAELAVQNKVELLLGATVNQASRQPDKSFVLEILSARDGVTRITSRAVVLAMGCRERNRGNLAIPGTRPAGIFTAGSAQKLINLEGVLPGRRAVIVGSGDIGLIMARRCVWSGMEVAAVVEIMPQPSGLPRNVAQCLDDYNIPLYLEHSVIEIGGRDRVQYVEAAPLKDGVPETDQKFRIDCDTILFSVGLVPENELSLQLGVELNAATGGAVVNSDYQTCVPGVFAAGNVLHVHDLVDFVSHEAAAAGQAVLRYLKGESPRQFCPAAAGANLKYVIPNFYQPEVPTKFSFRPLIVAEKAKLSAQIGGVEVFSKVVRQVRPAEMLQITLPATGQTGQLVFQLLPLEA